MVPLTIVRVGMRDLDVLDALKWRRRAEFPRKPSLDIVLGRLIQWEERHCQTRTHISEPAYEEGD